MSTRTVAVWFLLVLLVRTRIPRGHGPCLYENPGDTLPKVFADEGNHSSTERPRRVSGACGLCCKEVSSTCTLVYFCKGDQTGVCEAEMDGDHGLEGVKVPTSTHTFCLICSTDPDYDPSFGKMFCALSPLTCLSMDQ